jgi:phage shock protein E
MNRPSTRAVLLVLVALVAIAFAGCAGSSASAGPTGSAASAGPTGSAVRKVDASAAVGMLGSRTVVDVRTPAEYAAGHIAGARNIDVEASDFASQIAKLDKKAPYLVYCRSGRRSAIAASQMASAGFTDIVDGGAMADLVAAGAKTQ